MTVLDDIRLAELLCARVCHDLSGPVGAAAAGAELMEDTGGTDAETAALVAASAAGAAARLKFFRAALGPAGGPVAARQVHELATAYLRSAASAVAPPIALDWPGCPERMDGESARIALNLVLLARDALPRGGSARLEVAPAGVAITIVGEPASLGEEARAVLSEGAVPSGPRGAQAWFTRLLAAQFGGPGLEVGLTSAGLRISVDWPERGTGRDGAFER